MKILEFESIPSTNDYVKAHIADGEDMIVTAKIQTAGRGSKNRSFNSGMGGLYLTKLNIFNDFPASKVFQIMLNTSVAVCKTMEDFGLTPAIKWPNDVYVGGKKICGILIENTFSGAKIANSVVGIGVNINNELPVELSEIATTMSKQAGHGLSVDSVKDSLVKYLNMDFTVEEHKKYIFFLDREVFLLQGDEIKKVIARDIDGFGRLIVEENGKNIYTVTAGEVSLRFDEFAIKNRGVRV